MNELLELDRDEAVDPSPTSPQVGRGKISSARQAADALFAPKRPVSGPGVNATSTATDEHPRKPRILRAVEAPPAPVIQPTPSKQRELAGARQQISASRLAQIQVWMEYGMTVRQVAQVYGVRARDINRILETA